MAAQNRIAIDKALQLLFPNRSCEIKKLNSICEACIKAKMCRLSFFPSEYKSENCFDFIHSDVWSLAPIDRLHNEKYFIMFMDDKSWVTWIYFLNKKSEVFETFKLFHSMVHNQYQSNIKTFCTHNGFEYINNDIKNFSKINSIENNMP